MCNEKKTERSVEDMLRDIALVLRMTNQIKAEMRSEQVEREATRILQRQKKAEETLAVSM
jgi:hypothetical protein